MARRRTRIPLSVYLNGRLVGHLRRQSSGAIDFRYDPSWLEWDHALPVSLSLPLREDRFSGDPVIAVFDNLLPDSDAMRRRLAERTRAEGHDAYSLLAAVGRDCVGALQFLPEDQAPGLAGKVSGRAIGERDIARILDDLARTPLGVAEDESFRISLAGVQDKTALLYWKTSWHLPHGTTATTHIFKPQIGPLPGGIDLSQSVENEHFCMRLTAAFGLATARTKIQEFSGKHVLVVERFDRVWTKDKRLLRLPLEDFCQALSVPPTRKYEPDGGPGMHDIAGVLKGSDVPESDLRAFFKAQIVFWLIGATDGHAKNFSIFLAPGGRFHLSPLYDVMSVQPNLDAGQIRRNRAKLAMAVGDRRHYVLDTVLPRHFLQTAKRCGVSLALIRDIFCEIADTAPAAIDTALADLPRGFPNHITDSIVGGLRQRLRTLERASA